MFNSKVAASGLLLLLALSLFAPSILGVQTNVIDVHSYKVKTSPKDVYVDEDGYVFILTQQNFGGTNKTDIILIKLDPEGHVLWSEHYGGRLNQFAHSFSATDDGGFIICGTEARSLYVVKTDEYGIMLWEHRFTENLFTIDPNDIIQVGENYFVVGSLYNSTDSWIYVLKFNSEGRKLYEEEFDESDAGYRIIQTGDGNLLLASHDWIIKLSEAGKVLWRKSIQEDYDVGFDVYNFLDMGDGYLFVGQFDNVVNNVTVSRYIGFLKTAMDGEEVWSEMYGYPYALVKPGVQVLKTVEGGFLVTGYDSGYCLIKFDKFGEREWLQYTEDGTDVLAVNQDRDGNYRVVTGTQFVTYAADYPKLDVLSDYGIVSGEGIYPRGEDVWFSVSPEMVQISSGARAIFQGWVSHSVGGYNGSINPNVVTVNNHIVEQAIWNRQYYVQVNDVNGSTGVESDWYDEGSTLTFIAVPDEGYEFLEWAPLPEDAVYTVDGSRLSVTVTMPLTVEALYTRSVSSLSVVSEHGSVSGSGEYVKGSTVSFSVSPSQVVSDGTRYIFNGWTSGEGGYTGMENPASIVLSSDVTETAKWITEYYVNISSTGGGEVSPSSGWVEDGTNITLNAVPASGYTLKGWTINNENVENPRNTFSIRVDDPLTIVVSFERNNQIPSFPLISLVMGIIVLGVILRRTRKNFH